ncbi:hypothetical protein ACS0TY_017964 [Phlomoides rotata]
MIRNAKVRRQIGNFVSNRTKSSIASLTTLVNPSKCLKIAPQATKITYFSAIANPFKNQKLDRDVYLTTKMISSHVDNFRLDDALELFDETPVKDTVMWNLMIKGCVNCGNLEMGLKVFDEMPERNVVSWTTMINALFKRGRIEEAKELFCEMPVRDTAAWNAMVHGFFTNGRIQEAIRLFEQMPDRNVISWTTMISGLDQHGKSDEALSIFGKMVRIGLKPTSSTLCSAMSSCANVANLRLGNQVHGQVIKLGYVHDTYITASMITFYANCKEIEQCKKVFNQKLHRNVVVWTSLLTGYGANNKHAVALRVFGDMIRFGITPNQSSFTSVLNSACEMASVDWGNGIHCAAVKLGLETDVYVGNSLVVLYTKCGNIRDGVLSFKEIRNKNTVSWNSVIVGCGQHGCGEWALAFFSQMAKAGVAPDEITFIGLLNSCSHSGMLEKGRRLFESLGKYSSVEIKVEHYACMVDMLCRSGKLNEAEDLVKNMRMEPNVSIMLALLSGCREQLNVQVAERAAKIIFNIDPHCSAAYVLVSSIYAFCGRWSDAERIRTNMRRIGTIKQAGRSWEVTPDG